MGFLKFLKREKKENRLENLDLPPAPPPLEGFDENIPELPEFPDFGEEKISAKELPKFDFPDISDKEMPQIGKEDSLPDLPDFPELEEKPVAQISSAKAPLTPEPMPLISQAIEEPEHETIAEEPKETSFLSQTAYPKMERRLFSKEKRELREIRSGKAIYIRVDEFKTILGSINLVRSDLRKSEETLIKLENIKNIKDKSFDKFRNSLDDLQKKLIFIDKTIFRGE